MRSDETWARILVVDDQPPNVLLLERMLQSWGYEHVITTTQSSTVPDLCAAQPPDLILLDLQMPPPDGFELLEILAPMTQSVPNIPVLVVTADITQATRQRALSIGANDFLSKPIDPVEVRLRIGNLLETRRLQLELFARNQDLEGAVRERTRDLELARLELLERLALAAEYRDDNTQEHAQRVGRTSALLAGHLGLVDDEVEIIRRAAPLHDIGKIGIPDQILLKHSQLSAEEFELMKAHTRIGSEILGNSDFPILRTAGIIARTHHEAWDGSGYPDGSRGVAIPLVGRIVAIADVFDALVHERPYKPAWPVEQAVEEIERLAGVQFDPEVAREFASLAHVELMAPILRVGGDAAGAERPLPPMEATLRR